MNYAQSLAQNPLLCAEYHEFILLHHPWVRIWSHILPITPVFHSRKLFQFACPIHCWKSNESSSKRLPVQHSTYPTFLRETQDVARRSANFSPCFRVTCLNHFSHACLPCARPSQSETLRLRSHRDMGIMKAWRPTKCERKNCRTFSQKGILAAARAIRDAVEEIDL